jgi:hypothetical protein
MEIIVADLFDEVDEELRRDQFNRYWKKYGNFAIAGLVLIVVVTAGVVGWREYTKNQRIHYSEQFTAAVALVQDNKSNEAIDALGALAQDANIGYATLARFRGAALKAKAGDREGAAAEYDALSKDSGIDKLYSGLAGLYYVLNTIDSGDPEALAARLTPLTDAESPWRFSAREFSALLAIRQGKPDKAAEIYTQLADDAQTPTGARARAAEMLRALKQ